jgi:putative ABC transport system permease protein
MGMKIIAGRNFDPAIASDTVTSIVINEAMVKNFGWTNENAIGQGLTGYSETTTPVVIGVVKDFHFRPLKHEIKPQLFHQFRGYSHSKLFVRVKAGDPSRAIATMEKQWNLLLPEYPLKYSFLDDNLDNFYRSEKRWSKIIGWAGGISIFLASLGLFGLAALAAVNRTRELGIRKVLGSSLWGIVQLLSRDFLKLVLISFLISAPLAWYFMRKWLDDFAYRIQIGWGVFLFSAVGAMVIAMVTISIQAVKAGSANPVKSLRSE